MFRSLLSLLLVTWLAGQGFAQDTGNREFPEESAFRACLHDLMGGCDDGFSEIRGRLQPKENTRGDSDSLIWGVKPLGSGAPDLEGRRNYLHQTFAWKPEHWNVQVVYRMDWADSGAPKIIEAMGKDFETLAEWFREERGAWNLTEKDESNEGQRSLVLTPPDREGPSIRLRFQFWAKQPGGFCELSLRAETSISQPIPEVDGQAEWLAAADEAAEPAVELPPIPANLPDVVLGLVDGAIHSFAEFRTTLEPVSDVQGSGTALQEVFPGPNPRWALSANLDGVEDAQARHNYLSGGQTPEEPVIARVRLLRFESPNRGTRRAIGRRFEKVQDILSEALPGSRMQTFPPDPTIEGPQERIVIFHAIREDGGPVWVLLQEVLWFDLDSKMVIEHFVSVGAELDQVVGFQLPAVEGLKDQEPFHSAFAQLGDPLPDTLQDADRIAYVDDGEVSPLALYGATQGNEVKFTVVRDGAYVDLIQPAQWLDAAGFVQMLGTETLSPGGKAFLASRLDPAVFTKLVDDLVASAKGHFATLPAAPENWLRSAKVHELESVEADLYRSTTMAAPPEVALGFVERLRAHLGNDWRFVDGGLDRSYGPPLQQKTMIRAYIDGQAPFEPRVEIVQGRRGNEFVVSLRVEHFSHDHIAFTDHAKPSHSWFEYVEGDWMDFSDGIGRAYSYEDQAYFVGPFKDWLPNGEGRVYFRGGGPPIERALYEDGKFITEVVEKVKPVDNSEYWARFLDFPEAKPSPTRAPKQWHTNYETCVACWGSGTQWSKRTTTTQPLVMALSGTRAWRRGYTHIANRDQARTSTSSSEVPCYACKGTGKKKIQSYY